MFDDLIPASASSDPFADLVPPPQHKPGSILGALKRGAVDNLAELPIGAANAIKTVVDAFGAGSETAKGFERSAQFYQDLQSPERQAERQRQAQRTHAAEQSGSTWEEIKAAAQNFAESPLAATANAAGSLVPVVVAAKVAPLAAVGAVPAMLTTGAVMGAGAVKGGIYDDQLQRGMTPEQAEAAQAYGGENLDQIAMGAGLGALASSTGVEKVLGGATSSIRNTARRVLTGAVQEAVPEAIQGGQERLAANLAAQRAGFEDVPTWQGVAGQATAEGLASTGPGGIAGGVQRIADLQPAYVLRPDGQGVTAIDPSAGPISAAAAGHIHQQQAQGGLFDDLGQPTQGAGQMATPNQEMDLFDDLIPEQQDQYPDPFADLIPTSQQQAQASALTPEAEQLLAAVEAGGTPAFMTRNLKRVAAENGIDVTPGFTPNDVVEALRKRAASPAQAPEPRPFDLWRAEAPSTSLQEAQAAVEESRARGYDGHVVIQHGEGFGFVPRDWLSTDELKAAEALQPQAKQSAAPANPEPASEKDKWIKATVDKSRLNGSSGIQLEVAPDGGVMFMGDPNSNKDGKALLANYQQALKAGATPAEIAAALKTQAKPTPAASTTPAKTATGKRPNNAGVYWTPDVERSKEPTKNGAVLNVVQLADGSWTAGAGFGYVGGENLAGVARQDGQRAASREEAITQAVGYATERLDKIIARYEALPDYKDSAKYIAQAKERKAWLQAQLPGRGNAQAEPTFAPATVEDSNGKKREGFIAEFDNGKGGKGYIELAVNGERIYPTMVDNGLFKLSESTRGAVSKAYEQAIAFAEQNGKAFTSDDSVTVTAARIYDSLARKGYAVQKSPVARLATKPEVVTDRWVTDDGSPVFTVAQKAPAKAATPPATRATIEPSRSNSDGNATQQPGTQEAPAHGGGLGHVPQDGQGPGVRAGTGQEPARARYGTPRQGAVSVVGIHYSGAERQSLSGAYYSKGIKGAEAERLKGLPDQYRHRVHFYVDEGQGVFPEAGVGAHSHEVELLNLYDGKADPLGLAQGNQNNFNGFEQAVVGAGFDGYYIPQGFGRQGVAVVIGQHTIPVTYTGPKAAPAAPQHPILSDPKLPAGQVTGARWKELLAGRLEGVEKLEDGKRYYKDEAVRAAAAVKPTRPQAVELERKAVGKVKQPAEKVQTIQTKETDKGVALFNQATPGTISPADKAVFGMAAEGKSTKEILEFIAAGSRSAFNRQLARLMLAKGIEARVTVDHPKAWKIAAGPGKYAAAYSPKTNTVALFRPASAERHMLHEMMHAATMQALRKNGMASGQMKVLFRHVQKHLGKRGHYGLANLDEFVAEAFTNRQFQEALKRIPGAELSGSRLTSAWSWFVRVVRQILGLDSKQETALGQALELGVELMQPATRGRRGPVRGAQGERLAPNGKPSKLSERQWHQVRTPEFKAWFGDWEKAALRDFLDGAPLAQLQTAEAPHQGYAALREWAVSIFADYGFKAIHPELGEVLMDERAVRDSMGHRINPFKAVAFKVVPDVLENGRIVHRVTTGELESIYVAAPVRIDGVDDIVTVLVHRDPQTQRFYLHSVATKESLQNRKQSGAPAQGQRTPGAVRSGGIESILHDVLTFKAASQAIDRETGEPAVLWHGSRHAGFTQFKPNELGLIWASTNPVTAVSYSGGFSTPDLWAGESRKGLVPVFMNVRNPAEMDAGGQAFYDLPDVGNLGFTDWFGQQAKRDGKDGAVLRNIIDDGGMLDEETDDVGDDWIVFDPRQVKSADQNTGTFDPNDPDIRFNVAEDATLEQPERLTMGEWVREQLTNHRNWALGALTRDQLADIYGKDIPEVAEFSRTVARMDQVRNTLAEQADATIERWRKLPSAMADQLADVMHGATLAQFDPAKKGTPKTIEEAGLLDAWAALSPEAQALYKEVRDTYATTLGKLRNGLVARAERAGTAGQRIAAEIRLQFDQYLAEGPYFPLARFGDFVLIANKGAEKIVETFESAAAREKRGRQLRARGWRTRMTAKREYSAATDGPSGEFVGQVLKQISGLELPADDKAQLMDGLNQLAIAALPDQSYRRHFTHRKGTPGFNKDAMRAFASSMLHVAHHVARVQHGDELVFTLDALNQRIKETTDADTTAMQQVSNELARRLDQMMNPNTHPVAAAAGQVGFLMSLGGSVASGLVNLTQTPLVTYPWLGAKFGFDKAAAALTRASKDYFGGKWDKWSGFVMKDGKGLTGDEQKALQSLEEAGLISLTQAHDLAGTANTDKAASQRSYAINRAMKIIGWTFHVPEVANRQVSALAAYRLAREKGLDHDTAIETARETLQRTHFDYSASNRARFMAGNFTRVVTMFKQYSQNMTYLLWRNAYQALKGESPEVRREARRMLLGVAAMHFGAAGSLGLPLGVFGITPLLGLLALGMGDDDEPWDWQTEYRNLLADTFGPAGGEAIAKGPLRTLLGIDLASRVGLGDLWIRSPQAEKEGRDQVEAWMLTLLGPVAGYIGNMGTAAQAFSEGKTARGLEAMLPKFIASPIKAMRFETEGVRSWRGDDLGVPLDGADVLAVAVGFQPAQIAEMYEGRAAIKGLEAKLQGRREELVNMWVSATLAGDQSIADEALQLARAFSMKHPEMAISGDSLRRSLQSKVRSQAQIKDGAYLVPKREVLREAGRFANVG